MIKKPTKLDGLNIDNFEALLHSGDEINLQSARLIPFHKPGDEMSLTSILLSGLEYSVITISFGFMCFENTNLLSKGLL